MSRSCCGHWIRLISFISVAIVSNVEATPPPIRQEPVIPHKPQFPKDSSLKSKGEIRWEIGAGPQIPGGDFGGGHVIRRKNTLPAVNVEGLPLAPQGKSTVAKTYDVWFKQFDDPELKSNNGYANVVDEKVFTTLHPSSAQFANRLGPQGHEVGRVKLKEFDPEELVQFLVLSGIIDANLHVMATITGTHSTSDSGDWFALHSKDPYWTSQYNETHYDFGVHVARDGTIRLINQGDVGHPPIPKADEKSPPK